MAVMSIASLRTTWVLEYLKGEPDGHQDAVLATCTCLEHTGWLRWQQWLSEDHQNVVMNREVG